MDVDQWNRKLRADLLDVGFLNQCCIDILESTMNEHELPDGATEGIEQAAKLLMEGVDKLIDLSQQVAAGKITVIT
ncbi:TPA: hypothetical protein N2B29_004674 [Pseudomonas aeruginosa]|uniref:DUF7364 domain-containing protein n=1 Tax=Pseudomonas aeruginosa TaxID=287 RepID=UPI00053D7297|nr:hypothetical protein [Pseudomonas aeruginosa]MCD2910914.1 hypothetical protein [Pseudomonas aeruginosa]HCL3849892.1 hypothetical protein [Pseudomonas aeruginosa]HCL3873737.1 hypothetical protein [Pseudomonas aeruginosa]HCL3898377.1 hypothetical protein [Pseudomonas aeruginosa]HDY6515561.1 hypothetical protein [Pseudomonas aeruginosa]